MNQGCKSLNNAQNPQDLTARTGNGKIPSKTTQQVFVQLHFMHANAKQHENNRTTDH